MTHYNDRPPAGWYDGGLVNDLTRTHGSDEGARAAALALGAAVTEASASIAAASKPGSKQVSSRVRVEHKKEGMMHYSIEKNAKLPFFKLYVVIGLCFHVCNWVNWVAYYTKKKKKSMDQTNATLRTRKISILFFNPPHTHNEPRLTV